MKAPKRKRKQKPHHLEMDEIRRGKHLRKKKPRPTIRHKSNDDYDRKDKSWMENDEE